MVDRDPSTTTRKCLLITIIGQDFRRPPMSEQVFSGAKLVDAGPAINRVFLERSTPWRSDAAKATSAGIELPWSTDPRALEL